MKEFIPKKTIILPVSGVHLTLHEYLSTGETRNIQRILLETNMVFDAQGKPVETGVDSSKALAFLKMQETSLRYSFINAVKDDKAIEVEDAVSFVGDLPPVDGNIVYAEISELINRSSMTDAGKKN